MIATEPLVTFSVVDGVGRVTLNRPHTLNAWSLDFGRALAAVLREQATGSDVRAVLITGAGRAFSSGIDLRGGFSTGADGTHDLREELAVHHAAIEAARAIPTPVVAAVNGPAYGIGCSLALACDVVLAAESAVFGSSWTRIGLLPDGGATMTLASALGGRRAFELAALAQNLTGAEAAAAGLANAVLPDDELPDAAAAMAAKLAAGPTRALAALKVAVRQATQPAFAEQLLLEERLQIELAQTQDFPEGIAAFRENRPAAFVGS